MAISSVGLMACNQTQQETQQTCSNNKTANHLVQKDVSITYEQQLTVPEEYFFLKGINQADFISKICEKTTNAEITALVPFSKDTLSAEEIERFFVGIPDAQAPIPQEEIKYAIFNEKWFLDTAKFTMQKEVQTITLVREFMHKNRDGEEELTKSLITTYDYCSETPKDLSELKLLASDVAYEVPIVNELMPEWLKNIPVTHVINVVMDKLLDPTTPKYSFFVRDSLIAVSNEDARLRLGEETIEVEDYNEETGEYTIETYETTINYEEIVGLVFLEDWYVDSENMRIHKVVKGIGPVREYSKMLQEGEIETGRVMPFYAQLTQ